MTQIDMIATEATPAVDRILQDAGISDASAYLTDPANERPPVMPGLADVQTRGNPYLMLQQVMTPEVLASIERGLKYL
ncbi:MAG: hypothetical protein JNM13_02550 [Hyphomicrobiaceae bacterium]|nr:hypothetical protein [Hyphomicrobiaceae bacterium]